MWHGCVSVAGPQRKPVFFRAGSLSCHQTGFEKRRCSTFGLNNRMKTLLSGWYILHSCCGRPLIPPKPDFPRRRRSKSTCARACGCCFQLVVHFFDLTLNIFSNNSCLLLFSNVSADVVGKGVSSEQLPRLKITF